MAEDKEIKREELQTKVIKEVEDTFSGILDEKFVSPYSEGKEVIKFESIDIEFEGLFRFELDDLYEMYPFYGEIQELKTDLYIQKIIVVLAQLYEDIKQQTYGETTKMVEAEFVKTALEKALHKIKKL